MLHVQGDSYHFWAMVFYWDNLTHTSSPKPSVNMHPPTPEEYGWDLFDVVPGAGHSKDQWEAGGIKPKRWRQLGQQFDTKINCFSLLLEYIFFLNVCLKIKWYALKLTWIQKCNTGWCRPFLFLVETTIRTQVSVTFPLKGSCCGKIITGDFKHVLINVVLSNATDPPM